VDLQALRNELDQRLIAEHVEDQYRRHLPSLKLNSIDFQIDERAVLLARLPEGDSRRAEIEQEVAALSAQRAAVMAEYPQLVPAEVRHVEAPTVTASPSTDASQSHAVAAMVVHSEEPEGHRQARVAKKPIRRSPKYEKIDCRLSEISKARPKNHAEVFQFLDGGKVPLPNRKAFKSAGGWLKGFQKDRPAASAWLSTAWTRLKLPAFDRGPKK